MNKRTLVSQAAEFCALRDQGLTFAEIGKRMGTNRKTAQLVISRALMLHARKEIARQSIENYPTEQIPLREFLVANDASTRLINAMHDNRYETVGDVLEETEGRLLRLPHMGIMSVHELQTLLQKHGLQLKP